MGAGSSTAQGFVQFALSQEAGNSAQKVSLASLQIWWVDIPSCGGTKSQATPNSSIPPNTCLHHSLIFFDSNAWTDVCNSRCSRLSYAVIKQVNLIRLVSHGVPSLAPWTPPSLCSWRSCDSVSSNWSLAGDLPIWWETGWRQRWHTKITMSCDTDCLCCLICGMAHRCGWFPWNYLQADWHQNWKQLKYLNSLLGAARMIAVAHDFEVAPPLGEAGSR